MEDALDSSSDDNDADTFIAQVIDEVGISFSAVQSTAHSVDVESSDDDLAARLQCLKDSSNAFPSNSSSNVNLSSTVKLDDVGNRQSHLKKSPSDTLDILIKLQHFDGHWELTKEFADIVGIEMDSMNRIADKKGISADIWATSLAIIYLKLNLQLYQEEWDMVYNKSLKWLQHIAPNWSELLQTAMEFLTGKRL